MFAKSCRARWKRGGMYAIIRLRKKHTNGRERVVVARKRWRAWEAGSRRVGKNFLFCRTELENFPGTKEEEIGKEGTRGEGISKSFTACVAEVGKADAKHRTIRAGEGVCFVQRKRNGGEMCGEDSRLSVHT